MSGKGSRSSWRLGPPVLLVLALGLTVTGVAAAQDDGTAIHGCVHTGTGSLRVVSDGTTCRGNESPLSWQRVGPAGPQGPAGPAGQQGDTGPEGPAGADAVLPEEVTSYFARIGDDNDTRAGRGTECTIAEIMLSAGAVGKGTPARGQLLPINQNTALFSLIGTKFGGNGQTTFALPDLRGLAPNGLEYSICMQGVFPSSS